MKMTLNSALTAVLKLCVPIINIFDKETEKKVVTQPLEEDASTPHSSRINSHQLSTDSEAHKSQEEMMMRLIYYLGIMFNI